MVTEAVTLDKDAFARMVTEGGLKTTYASGYLYAGKQGKRGWEMYRTYINWETIPMSIGTLARGVAGTQYGAVTVPANRIWRLYRLNFYNTTDANVADRYPYLYIKDDGTYVSGVVMATTPQTASITSQGWSFVAGGLGQAGPIGNSLVTTVGFGNPVEIKAAGSWQLLILNIQATDRPDGSLFYAYKEVML